MDVDALADLLRETRPDQGSEPPVHKCTAHTVASADSAAAEIEQEQRTSSPVDIPSSETSTKGSYLLRTGPSTADEPSTGYRPSTRDRGSGWEVVKFARAHGYKLEGRLSVPEFITWKLRLEVEAGKRAPAEIKAAPLLDDVSSTTKIVYDGFVYLLACRWLHTPAEAAPFVPEFAAAWCGVTARQAKDARRELVKRKMLEHVGTSKRAKLWLPRMADG